MNHENHDEQYEVESSRDRYLKIFRYAEDKHISIQTHKDFISLFEEVYPDLIPPVQGTVSDHFRKFNIEKVDGKYEFVELVPDSTLAAQYLLSTNCSKLTTITSSDMFHFRVRTEIGSEHLICKLIYDTFSAKNYYAIIPGFGHVLVICRTESNAKSIYNFIRENKGYSYEYSN